MAHLQAEVAAGAEGEAAMTEQAAASETAQQARLRWMLRRRCLCDAASSDYSSWHGSQGQDYRRGSDAACNGAGGGACRHRNDGCRCRRSAEHFRVRSG